MIVVFARKILGLRVSSFGIRVVCDLCWKVNANTDFACATLCKLGHVMRDVLLQMLYLRPKFGRNVRVVLSKLDIKQGFKQIPIAPARAPVFEYVVDDLLVVDFGLQFGWRSSPQVFGRFVSFALKHSHTHPTVRDAQVFGHGHEAVESV